jgi:hypothetical protein
MHMLLTVQYGYWLPINDVAVQDWSPLTAYKTLYAYAVDCSVLSQLLRVLLAKQQQQPALARHAKSCKESHMYDLYIQRPVTLTCFIAALVNVHLFFVEGVHILLLLIVTWNELSTFAKSF